MALLQVSLFQLSRVNLSNVTAAEGTFIEADA